MVATLRDFKLEAESRRRSWTRDGTLVYLGDGDRWHLPRITRKLLASMPDLRVDLREVLALVTRDADGAGAADGLNIEPARCEQLLTAVAVRLLRENYDLPAYTWEGLLSFDEPVGMLSVVISVSYTLDASRDIWGPWLEAA